MTVSLVGVGVAEAASNTDLIVSPPTTYANGDLLVIFAALRGTVRTVAVPAGWTELFTWNGQRKVFGRIASGTQTDVTVTLDGSGGTGSTFLAQMVAFRSTTAFPALGSIVTAQATTSGTGANIGTPALNITTDAALAVMFGAKDDDWTSAAPPSGWTLIDAPKSTFGDDAGLVWAYAQRNADQDLAADVFTVTGGTSAAYGSAAVTFLGVTAGGGGAAPGAINLGGSGTLEAVGVATVGGGGGVPVSGTPGGILNIGSGAGMNHFSVQVAPTGAAAFATHTQAEIQAGYEESPYFVSVDNNTRVQFWARMDGPTTSGSAYARSELRELTLTGSNMAFNMATGDHWMTGKTRITHLPPNKPETVIAQLHDGNADKIAIRTQTVGGVVELRVRINGSISGTPVLMSPYILGTEFEWKIRVNNGTAEIYYNNMTVPLITSNALTPTAGVSTWYFKAGNYNQSNETIDAATEWGSAELRHLQHWHTGWPTPQPFPVAGGTTIPGYSGSAVLSGSGTFTALAGQAKGTVALSGSGALTTSMVPRPKSSLVLFGDGRLLVGSGVAYFTPLTLIPRPLDVRPHVEVLIGSLDAAVVKVTVWRTARGRRMKVRGMIGAPYAGSISERDFEAPFNVPASYEVETFNAAGTKLATVSPVTTTLTHTGSAAVAYIHDPLDPTTMVRVTLSGDALKQIVRTQDGTTSNVPGRTVGLMLPGTRGGVQGAVLDCITENSVDSERLGQLLAFEQYNGAGGGTTLGIVCIRTMPETWLTPVLFAFVSSPGLVALDQMRRAVKWLLTVDETIPPTPAFIVPLLTYQDFTDYYGTYAAFAAAYPNYAFAARDYGIAGV